MNKLVFTLLLFFMPISALASPFCITVIGMNPDCIYDDPTSCKTRAAQLGGSCTVNTQEISSTSGTEKFCLVDSTRVPQCIYVDRSGCENAQNNSSVCVSNNFKKVNDDQIDPFAEDPNRNY